MDRKFLKYLPIIILAFFGVNQKVLAYDSTVTHPALTKEVFEFYNNFYSNKISEENINLAMKGAIEEDEPLVRTINHFYDPISGKGLNNKNAELLAPFISILNPLIKSAKEWAQNTQAQSNFLLEFYNNSTLNPYARLVENPNEISATHTWDKAIYNYINGDIDGAFENLGHVLHLLEDMAVPAHTRNDHHLSGDPYENWVTENIGSNMNTANELTGFSPIIFGNLDDYFLNLALYSNNNFYSKETIGIQSGYKFPEWDYLNTKIIGQDVYSINTDNFGEYFLVKKDSSASSIVVQSKFTMNISDSLIRGDYWSHLSKQAVLYGAGVVNLFFQEVEKYKNDQEFLKIQKQTVLSKIVDKLKGLLSNVVEIFSGSSDDNYEFVISSGLVEGTTNASPTPSPTDENSFEEFDFFEENLEVTLNPTLSPVISPFFTPTPSLTPTLIPVLTPTPTETLDSTPTPTPDSYYYSGIPDFTPIPTPIVYCSQENYQTILEKSVIINEIAWMGDLISSSHEWIELKNVSNQDINIKNWQLLDKENQIKISFGSSGVDVTIPAGGFYLLERTSDDSALLVTADLIYSGALNDSNELIRLFDGSCQLVDEAVADVGDAKNWIAGDKTNKKTMERGSDFSWHTYFGNEQNGIFGTPKKENSVFIEELATPTPTITPTPTPTPKVLISEIRIEGQNIGDEFIELYNPNNFEVDLSEWSIQYLSGTASSTQNIYRKNFNDESRISAYGYFLIARALNDDATNGYQGGETPDLTHRTFSLSGSPDGATIFLVASQNDILGVDDFTIIDRVAYGNGLGLYPETQATSVVAVGMSLERKALVSGVCVSSQLENEYSGNACDINNNLTDFMVRDNPRPQNSQSLIEPRNQPAKPINLSGEIQENDKLVFSFGLENATSTNAEIIVKYATSSDVFSEGNFNNLSSPSSTAILLNQETGRYETELLEFSSGIYYFVVITKDQEGWRSSMSDAYQWNIPFCDPHYIDVGNQFINQVAFYSCLGKTWLDFTLYNFPNPMPPNQVAYGFLFFVNKIEDQVCNDSSICFNTGLIDLKKLALAVDNWGGATYDTGQGEINSTFVVSYENDRDTDYWMGSFPKSFHFEVMGQYSDSDVNPILEEKEFLETDFIAPTVLSWSSGPQLFRISESKATDYVFFEKTPRKTKPVEPKNFSAIYNEINKKFVFSFDLITSDPNLIS